MNVIKVELMLIIIVIAVATVITHKENLVIESKLDAIKEGLAYLTKYFSDSINSIICKKQLEVKKQSPHLPVNKDDIDDEGWRKP